MQGFAWNGNPYIDPTTGNQTKFCLPGDPVGKTGWYEGEGWPDPPKCGDRNYFIASGPFDMEPGDTQEVVYAIFMARGSDNIQSVAELKNTARKIHEFWGNDIPTSVDDKQAEQVSNIPIRFNLSQNYPNPFNPSTIIKYEIPSTKSPLLRRGFRGGLIPVQLVVYDILGREVATLVNKHQPPGSYEVEFRNNKLSSGVYFYQLKIYPARSGADKFEQTRKMLLLR
ncbi:T9SS type A sorting domain-containing protein [Bacteroidota bacterium]